MGNKDKNFWGKLEDWDVMILMETWVEERGWGRVKGRVKGLCVGDARGKEKEQKGWEQSHGRDGVGNKERVNKRREQRLS